MFVLSARSACKYVCSVRYRFIVLEVDVPAVSSLKSSLLPSFRPEFVLAVDAFATQYYNIVKLKKKRKTFGEAKTEKNDIFK